MTRKHSGVGILLGLCVLYCLICSIWKFGETRTVSSLQISSPTIVIDAGHGGEDCGALAPSGIKESDVNLAFALKLEKILALCGMKCQMIRTDDAAVSSQGETIRERKRSDLNNRVEMINRTDGILVSIHQNHFSDRKYHGAQVFYADTAGSKELAVELQSLLRSALDPSNRREIKRAESVFIMKKIQCTGILVECGFLSNPGEETLLLDSAYQTKLSAVIGCALAQHLEKGEMDV